MESVRRMSHWTAAAFTATMQNSENKNLQTQVLAGFAMDLCKKITCDFHFPVLSMITTSTVLIIR